jgi:hypothetical protein
MGAEEAACGKGVRVIYRMPFDTDDPDACRRCVEMAILRERNPDEFQRRIDQRHERWRERDEERRRGFGPPGVVWSTDSIDDEEDR